MASVSTPIHISAQRPQLSSLYLLPRRTISSSTTYGLLKSRVFDSDSILSVTPLLENGKHRLTLPVVQSGRALGLFGLDQHKLRRRSSVEFLVVAAASAAADTDESEVEVSG